MVVYSWSGQLEMLWFVRGFILCRIVRTDLRVVMASVVARPIVFIKVRILPINHYEKEAASHQT